jgi:type-F conjugative transfer system pilin assembly protein TrbC
MLPLLIFSFALSSSGGETSSIQHQADKAHDVAKIYENVVKQSARKAAEVSKNSVITQNHNLKVYPSRCSLNQDCFGRMSKEQAPIAQNRNMQFQPLVFVSSSMPKTSLQQLALEAKAKGARLIIRGMVNNSMKDTVLLVKEINHPLDIDPKLFKKYRVTQVPTFVIPHEDQGNNEWHVIRGNISLGFALDVGKGETTRDKQESHP